MDNGDDRHFFGANFAEWRCTNQHRDLRGLINFFEMSGLPYAIWLVPGPHDRGYKIENYMPVVDDRVFIGSFDPKYASD